MSGERAMGGGKRPTKAQRSILERMAAGSPIRVGVYGRLAIASERGGILTDTVLEATRAAMFRNGWIQLHGNPARYSAEYRITDAGRQALAARSGERGEG